MRRPTWTNDRQIAHSLFTDTCLLIRRNAQRDSRGLPIVTDDTPRQIPCLSAPQFMPFTPIRQRIPEEGGVRLEAVRILWTLEPMIASANVRAADRIIWHGETWHIHMTQDWGGYSESVLVRNEVQ